MLFSHIYSPLYFLEKQETDAAPIKVTLPDGKVVDAMSWISTPYEVACGIR